LTHLPYGFHRSGSRGFYHDFAYAHLAHLAWRDSFRALSVGSARFVTSTHTT
jgi:hypothetical protein